MKYLIELSMLYEVDTGIIMIEGEEETSLKLSNQAGRLLYELIINNGKTLNRDELIKSVWEDRGFIGSSVSLNVAISEIRKAFRTLGSDPLLIKTVRGKGFSLSAHIEHHTVRPPVIAPVADLTRREEYPVVPRRNILDSSTPIMSQHRVFLSLCFLVLIVFISAVVLLFCWQPSFAGNVKDPDRLLLGNVNRCQVYLLDKNLFQPPQYYFNRVKSFMAAQHIDCDRQFTEAYYSLFKKMHMENDFLAVCYRQGNGDDYQNCISYRSLTGS